MATYKKQNKKFLTKICRFSFAGYAIDQIKKAKGYDKKINWEESEMKRKTVLDFCYVLYNEGSMLLNDWFIHIKPTYGFDLRQEDFALSNIEHAHNLYAMHYLPNTGIISDLDKSNDVQLHSIPKEVKLEGYLTFNKDSYSTHCKKYKEYQDWILNRNEDRFKMNKEHGKNYDSKNLMHTFRLLNVAIEIAKTCNLNVRRSPEEIKTLMQIRRGEYELDKLIEDAEQLISNLDELYDKCSLPNKVDQEMSEDLLLTIRKLYYGI